MPTRGTVPARLEDVLVAAPSCLGKAGYAI